MATPNLGVLLTAALVCALVAGAGEVGERELVLRNRLDTARAGEWVVVALAELGVPADEAARVRGVEVLGEDGTALPAQFDAFAVVPDGAPEFVVIADLPPRGVRRLRVRLLDQAPAAPAEGWPCQATVDGKLANVRTPVATFPVRQQGGEGLVVEQPRLPAGAAPKPPGVLDAPLDDLLGPGGRAPAKLAPAAPGPGDPPPAPPQDPRGLPFCLQGYAPVSPAARLVAWGGPLRAIVALHDPGPLGLGGQHPAGSITQLFWFPRAGMSCQLEVRLRLRDAAPKAAPACGGVRLDSLNHAWTATFGLDRQPPFGAPVRVALRCTGKAPYLEGYQRAALDLVWGLATSPGGSVLAMVDRAGSRFGQTTDWDTGRVLLPNNLTINDPGPNGYSLQFPLRPAELPAGYTGRVRVAFHFAAPGAPPLDGVGLAAAFNDDPVLRPVATQPAAAPDPAAIATLANELGVLVVGPDGAPPTLAAAGAALAARLGGGWRTAAGCRQFYNVMGGDRPDQQLLTVLTGAPGANALLDQYNATLGIVNPYPVTPDRPVATWYPATAERGAVLALTGNTDAAAAAALAQFTAALGPAPVRPVLVVSAPEWAAAMPRPWHGTRPHAGPFRALAWRGGTADFLVLLRANQPVRGLKLDGPPGATARWVTWRYAGELLPVPRVTAGHDPARPEPPAELPADGLASLWLTLPVAADAPPGEQTARAMLTYDGGRAELALVSDVLVAVLPARRALGFYPMGMSKEMLQPYFAWDDAAYYEHLPALLRQWRALGADSFTLDIRGLTVTVGANGALTVDASALAREWAIVRAAGEWRYLEIHGLTHTVTSKHLAALMKARKLDDEAAAWDLIAPKIKAALDELGLTGKLVCRYADEISDYGLWLTNARQYQRCGLTMTVAINGYGVEHRAEGVGVMGLWMPLYNFYLNRWGAPIADDRPECFNRQFRDERHAAGEAIWPYVCGPGPYAWSPRARGQVRFLALDTYWKGADGLTYYGGAVWSHVLDPAYRRTRVAPLLECDATFSALVYPDAARGELLPTLRWASVRQGLDDASATAALRARAAAAGKGVVVEAALAAAFALVKAEAPQAVFDEYRRALDRLWRECGP